MSRSLKKGPFVDFKLAKKVAALGIEDRTIIKTWARASVVSIVAVFFTKKSSARGNTR